MDDVQELSEGKDDNMDRETCSETATLMALSFPWCIDVMTIDQVVEC